MTLREETRRRIDEFINQPKTPENMRAQDAFFDSLPQQERAEAANYVVDAAKAKFDRDINL